MKKIPINSLFAVIILLSSCSISKKINAPANDYLLKNEAFATAHTGISIYEPATGKYWYNYQAEKYFVPASNTKIPTCFVAMKYLGDEFDFHGGGQDRLPHEDGGQPDGRFEAEQVGHLGAA